MIKTPVNILCKNKREYRRVQEILFKNGFKWCCTGVGVWYPAELREKEDDEECYFTIGISRGEMYNFGEGQRQNTIPCQKFLCMYGGNIQLELFEEYQ